MIDGKEFENFVLAFFSVVAINQIYPLITMQRYILYLDFKI